MPWDVISRTFGLDGGGSGFVRGGLEALRALIGLERTPAQNRAAFTMAFIALAAKMAKADGCVAPIEAATFERLYRVDTGEAANVRMMFDLASADTAGYESYARQIARLLSDERAETVPKAPGRGSLFEP